MVNFVPAYKSTIMSWKPALKLFGGPFLALGSLFMLEMTHNRSLPHGAPIGIINQHGVCYLASAIQILDAAQYASRGGLERVVESGGPRMLEAYRNLHKDVTVFRGELCLDPDKLVKAWVDTKPEEYKRPYIIKQTEEADGSLSEEELFPELVGQGVGGDSRQLLRAIMDEFADRCHGLKKLNPFQLVLTLSRNKTQKVNVVWYDTSGTSDQKDSYDFMHWDGTVVTANYSITRSPKILVMMSLGCEKHTLPLHITLRDSHNIAGSYRLLGAIYGFPIIEKPEGVRGNHAIAVVRYGDTWYECDNHCVKPYATERDFVDMVEQASRVSYRGAGMPGNTIPCKHPMVVMYELQ